MTNLFKLAICCLGLSPGLVAAQQAISDLGQASGADPTSIKDQVEHIKDSVQSEKFSPLETYSRFGDFAVTIESTVEIIKAVPQEYVAKVNAYYKYHDEEAPPEALLQAYKYSYAIILNTGTN